MSVPDSQEEMDDSQESQESDAEELDYIDDVDRESVTTTDSVKILHLTEEERLQGIKDLDAEMSGKMMQLHQLMYDGGLTQTTCFMQDRFEVTDTGKKAIKSPNQVSRNQPEQRGMVKGRTGDGQRCAESNCNHNHNPDICLTDLSKSVEDYLPQCSGETY